MVDDDGWCGVVGIGDGDVGELGVDVVWVMIEYDVCDGVIVVVMWMVGNGLGTGEWWNGVMDDNVGGIDGGVVWIVVRNG